MNKHTHESEHLSRVQAHLVDLALAELGRGTRHSRTGFDLTGGKGMSAGCILFEIAARISPWKTHDEQIDELEHELRDQEGLRDEEMAGSYWHVAEIHAIVASQIHVSVRAFRADAREEAVTR